MDELLKQISLNSADLTSTFTVWEVMASIASSFLLILLLAMVYRLTHEGVSYSQSFVHSMVLVGVTISVIMLIIGSNLARAFALVGALSIIRFRNAVKDTRDVAFIFVAMAIGMACGTRFYTMAMLFAVSISAIAYFLHRFEIGSKDTVELMLRIHVPDGFNYQSAFAGPFGAALSEYTLVSVDAIYGEELTELAYTCVFKRNVDQQEFLQGLREANPQGRVALLTGLQNAVL